MVQHPTLQEQDVSRVEQDMLVVKAFALCVGADRHPTRIVSRVFPVALDMLESMGRAHNAHQALSPHWTGHRVLSALQAL